MFLSVNFYVCTNKLDMKYFHFIVMSVVLKLFQISAQKVSAYALVVIDDVFHKIINTHEGFFDKKDTLEIPVCLYLCSITSVFSLKIVGPKEQGGIIKLVAVVHMALNFLITDKLDQNFSNKNMTN